MTDSGDQLRDLLRTVAVTDPVPAEVDARLEETLATLQEGRAAVPSHRRWRMIGAGAVAAAAVGVVAIGVAHLPDLSTSTAGASAAALSSANLGNTRPSDVVSAGVPASAPASPSAEMNGLSNRPSAYTVEGSKSVPSFVTSDFAAQAAAWWAEHPSLTQPPACSGPWQTGPSQPVAAVLDGHPAALLVFPAQGSTRLLEIFRCSAVDTPAAQATVPAS